MNAALRLKPNHKAIRAFFQELATLQQTRVRHEGAVAPAFAALLRACASQVPGWKLVEQYAIQRDGRRPIGQVIQVSVETVRIVKGLPALTPTKPASPP